MSLIIIPYQKSVKNLFYSLTFYMNINRSCHPLMFLAEWLRIDEIQRGKRFPMQEKVFRSQMHYC